MTPTNKLRSRIGGFAHHHFVETADSNYVISRRCAWDKFFREFWYLGAQSVEKICKAIILLNGRSSKRFGHDLEKLLIEVREIARELIPSMLLRPHQVPKRIFDAETIESFVGRLNHNGNSDSRYDVFGYRFSFDDLLKIDQLYWYLRRLAVDLDRPSGIDDSFTFREILTEDMLFRDSNQDIQSRRFRDIEDGKHGSELKSAFLNWNFGFAPSDYHHEPVRPFGQRTNTEFQFRMDDIFSDKEEIKSDGVAFGEWLLRNVRFSKQVEIELKEIIAKTKSTV